MVAVCVNKLSWSLDELVEDEGEGEEPGVCTKEQMEFDLASTWLGDDGMPVLAEGQAQGLIDQVFFPSLPSLIPLLFDFGISFSPSCLWSRL